MFSGMSDEAQGCDMDPFSCFEFSPVFGEGGGWGGGPGHSVQTYCETLQEASTLLKALRQQTC